MHSTKKVFFRITTCHTKAFQTSTFLHNGFDNCYQALYRKLTKNKKTVFFHFFFFFNYRNSFENQYFKNPSSLECKFHYAHLFFLLLNTTYDEQRVKMSNISGRPNFCYPHTTKEKLENFVGHNVLKICQPLEKANINFP